MIGEEAPPARPGGSRQVAGLPPTISQEYVRGVAATLAERLGLDLVDGRTLRVKSTPTHHIDVYQTIFNWRLATTPVAYPWAGHSRGWCYPGQHGFVRAYQQALLWPDEDDEDAHEPELWYKAIHGASGRVRPEHFYD